MSRHGAVRAVAHVVVLLAVSNGCSTAARQRAEIANLEAEAAQLGHPEVTYEQTLDPDRALALSFLPFGVAGFYVHRPGLGVSGILCWPLSITWTAPMAPSSARYYDYDRLRRQVASLREEARLAPREPRADATTRLRELERLWKDGRISDREYQEGRQRVLQDVVQ